MISLVPDFDEYSRRQLIAAPPEQIMPWLINFRMWRWWSPWENLDPRLKRWYGGLLEGVGATYEWAGNRRAGSGHMEITHIRSSTVDLNLKFTRPFRTDGLARFELLPLREATNVVWTVRNPRTTATRVVGAVMNPDKVIGEDLEKGLARLKELVEAGAQPTF